MGCSLRRPFAPFLFFQAAKGNSKGNYWVLAWGVFGSDLNGYFTFFTRFYLVIQLDTTYLQAWALMYLWQLTLDLTCLCFCMFL